MKTLVKELGLLLLVAIISATATIMIHESGHFTAAKLFKAKDVVFQFANVAYTESSIPIEHTAIVSLMGPVVTAIITVYSLLELRKRFSPFFAMVGIVAPLRALASVGFIIFSLRGITDRQFTGVDEWEFATRLGISPLIPILISLGILFFSWYYSLRAIKREKGWKHVPLYIVFAVVGVATYILVIGPLLAPGGPTIAYHPPQV